MVTMEHYLIVSSIMFFRRSLRVYHPQEPVGCTHSIELILNSVEINFCVFNRFLYPEHMEGMFFSLFEHAI